MKVWVVETGDRYDDGMYVSGLFTTKQLADEYAKRAETDRNVFAYVRNQPMEITTELEPFEYPPKEQVWHTTHRRLSEGILAVSSSWEYVGNYPDFQRGMEFVCGAADVGDDCGFGLAWPAVVEALPAGWCAVAVGVFGAVA